MTRLLSSIIWKHCSLPWDTVYISCHNGKWLIYLRVNKFVISADSMSLFLPCSYGCCLGQSPQLPPWWPLVFPGVPDLVSSSSYQVVVLPVQCQPVAVTPCKGRIWHEDEVIAVFPQVCVWKAREMVRWVEHLLCTQLFNLPIPYNSWASPEMIPELHPVCPQN